MIGYFRPAIPARTAICAIWTTGADAQFLLERQLLRMS